MSNCTEYKAKILKTYGILCDFDGDVGRVNLPASQDDETYSSWKRRVLGADVSNVVIYRASEPAPQSRIRSLSDDSLRHLVSNFVRSKTDTLRVDLESATAQAVDDARREENKKVTQDLAKSVTVEARKLFNEKAEQVHVKVLNDYLNDHGDSLVASVRQQLTILAAEQDGSNDIRSFIDSFVNLMNQNTITARATIHRLETKLNQTL